MRKPLNQDTKVVEDNSVMTSTTPHVVNNTHLMSRQNNFSETQDNVHSYNKTAELHTCIS